MTFRIRAASTTDVDVAIVGAGPSGAAAACHFARAGFRVTLLDQRRFPRDKVCGDFVGPTALAELDQLGLSSQPTFREANRICHGSLFLNGNTAIERRPFPYAKGLRNYGLCIPRMLLDDAIVQCAVASGTRLLEETHVTGYESDATGVTIFHRDSGGQKRLRTRLLIGADGSSSIIARVLRGGQHPWRDRIVAARAYFEGVDGPADEADLYVNSPSFPGYCWLFPTGTNLANVGVGMLLEAWAATNQKLSQLLAELIESDPAIRVRLGKAKMSGKIVGWPLTTFNPQVPIIANRVALLGDAAGLVNPISGEGIQYALRSARWSWETLRSAVYSDRLSIDGLSPYATRVQAEMRYDMAILRLMIDLTRNRGLHVLWLSLLEVVAKNAACNSEYYNIAAGVFGGVVPARELLALRFVLCTVKAAAMAEYAAVIDWLPGPRRQLKKSATVTNTVPSIFKYFVSHPIATLDWSLCCALGALELAKQIAISAIG